MLSLVLHVVNELEEREVERQFLLRDAPLSHPRIDVVLVRVDYHSRGNRRSQYQFDRGLPPISIFFLTASGFSLCLATI